MQSRNPKTTIASSTLVCAAGALALLATLGQARAASSGPATAASCADLARLALPDATVTVAETVAAGAYRPPAGPLARIAALPGMNWAGRAAERPNPAFCRVAATLRPTADSAIRVEVWLPLAGWNGKFLGVGSFGWGGTIMTGGMLTGVAEGYAAASTDTGHDSSAPEGEGGRFALGHPEKLVDYAHRADHLMTVDAKAIVAAFYGTGPARSYWVGCSLGGLEGLIEAERYPADYDGIVAGAPPNPIVKFNAAQLWPSALVARDPAMRVPKAKFAAVASAVLAACATPVGLAQGFVEEPARCGFDYAGLLCAGTDAGADAPDCLTAPQVSFMEQVHRGPVDPRTDAVIFPGPAKGSEADWAGFADGRPFPTALDLFRYAAFGDPGWTSTAMDWDRDVAAATAKLGPLLHVGTDLRPFFARGGRLLIYVGWNDYHDPEELVGYYGALMRIAGPAARGAARLFTVPGMGHCFGGPSCDTFDKLGAMDAWVDRGAVPERVVASRVEDGRVVRTRPLCAEPRVARYGGAGDMADASSFACVEPQAEPSRSP